MKLFINFLLSSVVAFLCIWFLPGLGITDYPTAAFAAGVLGLAGISVKPFLGVLGIIPTFLTIIATLFFANGLILVLLDWTLEGFSSESTLMVILFSAILAFFDWVIHRFVWK